MCQPKSSSLEWQFTWRDSPGNAFVMVTTVGMHVTWWFTVVVVNCRMTTNTQAAMRSIIIMWFCRDQYNSWDETAIIAPPCKKKIYPLEEAQLFYSKQLWVLNTNKHGTPERLGGENLCSKELSLIGHWCYNSLWKHWAKLCNLSTSLW